MNKKIFEFREPNLNDIKDILYYIIVEDRNKEQRTLSGLKQDVYIQFGTNWFNNFQVYEHNIHTVIQTYNHFYII